MKTHYSLIVIGSGIAGLSAAIHANELGIDTLLISKESKAAEGNSRYAQGGIIFADPSDETLKDDFLRASSGTANEKMVELIRQISPKVLQHVLLDLVHVPFEKDSSGHYLLTKEGAHSHPRILFKGDYSGRAIVESMLQFLEHHISTVDIVNSFHACKLHSNEGAIQAIDLYNENEVFTISCHNLILATGGCAGLYLNTSNYPGALGEGMGMAIAAGAQLKDMEFIQFHPTTLYLKDSNLRFLISEAVRGEGALLRNCEGYRFMPDYHPEAELASRDKVSLAIVEEMKKTNHPCVYLDISMFATDHFSKRFPTIAQRLKEMNIEYQTLGIPVVPSAHFTCGGIKTDEWGLCRGMQNLYAVGETACTGLHGANRLASSALLEGLMMGSRAVDKLSSSPQFSPGCTVGKRKYSFNPTFNCSIHYFELANLLWTKVGIQRSNEDLQFALKQIEKWLEEASNALDPRILSWKNSLLVAEQITQQSLARNSTIGCFQKN